MAPDHGAFMFCVFVCLYVAGVLLPGQFPSIKTLLVSWYSVLSCTGKVVDKSQADDLKLHVAMDIPLLLVQKE